ncbi:hypothetical protein AVEN_26793-1, partial [Araneus ventricosus]
VIAGCLLLLTYVTAGPVKARAKVEEKVEEEPEGLDEEGESEEDLVQEGGAHLGRYVGARDKDYDEYYGEEDAYEGKAGHEKAHKAGAVHDHYEHEEADGYKKHKEEHGAHGAHHKEGHHLYDDENKHGGYKDFKKEGEVYDKHGSDHKAKLEKDQHIKVEEVRNMEFSLGRAGAKWSDYIGTKDQSHGFSQNVYHKVDSFQFSKYYYGNFTSVNHYIYNCKLIS